MRFFFLKCNLERSDARVELLDKMTTRPRRALDRTSKCKLSTDINHLN